MLAVREGIEDELHSHLVVRNRKILYDLLLACSSVLETTRFETDFLHDTFREDIINLIALHIKQLVLDG